MQPGLGSVEDTPTSLELFLLKSRQLAGKGNRPEEPDRVTLVQQVVWKVGEEFLCLTVRQKDSVILNCERGQAE